MGMPPRLGGRHWIRTADSDTVAITTGAAARTSVVVVDGASIAEFAYAARWDMTDDTAPIPVTIPGPRPPLDGSVGDGRPFRIDAGTQRLFAAAPGGGGPGLEQGLEQGLDSATVAVRSVQGSPVFVDETGRRKRWLTLVGASAVTVCAAYVAVVGVSVLHGTDIGPVGSALAGLLPPTVTADAPEADDTDVDLDSPPAGAESVAPRVAVIAAAEQVRPTSSLQVAAPPTTRRQPAATARATPEQSRASRSPIAGTPSSDITTARPPTATGGPSVPGTPSASPPSAVGDSPVVPTG